MRRLDSRYDWIPEAVEFTNKTLTLSDFGDGCTTTSKNLMKKLALVYRGGPANCTYFTKACLVTVSLGMTCAGNCVV